MPRNPHDLEAEFPDQIELLHRLKMTKGHFAALADRYQEVNDTISRMRIEYDPACENRLEDLKKERLSLLDRIGGMLHERRREPA